MLNFENINWNTLLWIGMVGLIVWNIIERHHNRGLQIVLHALIEKGSAEARKVYYETYE